MADQDMPDSRAIRIASIMWRSASERSCTAPRNAPGIWKRGLPEPK